MSTFIPPPYYGRVPGGAEGWTPDQRFYQPQRPARPPVSRDRVNHGHEPVAITGQVNE
jgi:hypothetical protein